MMERQPKDIRRWAGVSLLGLCHGCGDFNAGILLAMIGSDSGADLVMMYLLYNVLAFVGQPFAGLICDRLGQAHQWFYFGCLLSVSSLLLVEHHAEFAIICSGVASAFYHSAGGATAWDLGGKRILATGLFTAPGVVGIALGLNFGAAMSPNAVMLVGTALLIALLVLVGLLYGVVKQEIPGVHAGKIDFSLIGGVFGWMILLAIAARSFAWSMGQQAIFPPGYAVNLAIAAAVGKVIASVLADKMGAGIITIISLLIAAVLLVVGGKSPLWFFPAVTALQAGTGPMMAMVLRTWPRFPAFGSGLAQGLAVAMGGVPILMLSGFGVVSLPIAVGALVFAAVIVLIVFRSGLRKALAR